MSIDELEFSIFVIHRLAESWNRPVSDTYRILTETDILDGYILKCYDTLHTVGTEYLINDLTEFARERGALV
jgi:hypothetical protein